jgi:hypothetical protein
MTAQPSPEFRSHHDVEAPRVDASAFRQGWKVATRLDQLHDVGAIDAATWNAAVQFRRDYELVRRGLAQSRVTFVGAGGRSVIDEHDRQFRRLEAASRLRRIADRLGVFAAILQHFVGEDWAFARIAAALDVSPHTARHYVIVALNRLRAAARTPPEGL